MRQGMPEKERQHEEREAAPGPGRDGHRRQPRRRDVRAVTEQETTAEATEVEYTAGVESADEQPPAKPAVARSAKPTNGARVAGWTMIGAGVVGAVAGLAFGLTTSDHSKAMQDADYRDAVDSYSCVLQGGSARYCTFTDASDAAQVKADKDDAKRQTTRFVIAGIGTAVAVGGVIVIAVAPRRETAAPEATAQTQGGSA